MKIEMRQMMKIYSLCAVLILSSTVWAIPANPYWIRFNQQVYTWNSLKNTTNTIKNVTNDLVFEIQSLRTIAQNDPNVDQNELMQIEAELNLAESNDNNGTLRVLNHVIPACESYADSADNKLTEACGHLIAENWAEATNCMNQVETFLLGIGSWHNEFYQVDEPAIRGHIDLATIMYIQFSGN
jgi:hypothetical protein